MTAAAATTAGSAAVWGSEEGSSEVFWVIASEERLFHQAPFFAFRTGGAFSSLELFVVIRILWRIFKST
jgi:hypothetical protein